MLAASFLHGSGHRKPWQDWQPAANSQLLGRRYGCKPRLVRNDASSAPAAEIGGGGISGGATPVKAAAMGSRSPRTR